MLNSITDSIFLATMRGHFRKKFEFKDVHKILFTCNAISDELDLQGWGTVDSKDITRKMNTLKLSENSEFTDMFLMKIKTKIEFKEIRLVYLTIDFLKKEINSEIYFTDENDNKRKISLVQKNGKINQVS